MMPSLQILQGDCLEMLKTLPDESVHCCVTSPPYWGLRDYGVAGQIGLEPTPEAYVAKIVEVFREVRRVLRGDGTCWVNLGSSYATSGIVGQGGGWAGENADNYPDPPSQDRSRFEPRRLDFGGFKPKDMVPIPWMVAMALQKDGWWLRQDIIWAKPNPMPESVTDRCTKAHEYVFLLAKSATYFYDAEAVKEPCSDLTEWTYAQPDKAARAGITTNGTGKSTLREFKTGTRNRRSVWTIPSEAFNDWEETSHWVHVSRDDVSDGSLHIASPNCPDHGGLFDLLAKVLCVEHGDGFPNHIADNGIHLVPRQDNDSSLSGSLLAWSFGHETLDLILRHNGLTATRRSSESRKTDHVPWTMFPCKPSAQRFDDIVRRLAQFGLSERHRDIFESRTWPDEMDVRLLPRMIYRRLRKREFSVSSSCCCRFYTKVTKKTSHFATFPTALVKPCIMAGTSAKGCCPNCGAPWERVINSVSHQGKVTHGNPELERGPTGRFKSDGSSCTQFIKNRMGDCDTQTTGWTPTCSCDCSSTVPCTVLDPFGGSCTTGQVALELGRNVILIELNPDYVALGRKRCHVTPSLPLA